MSEDIRAQSLLIEQLGLTDEQEAKRQSAVTWLEDAVATYNNEVNELSKASFELRTGSLAVAPHISSAPDHIKHGTQIDQEIWRAENAEEDDWYDEPSADEIEKEREGEAKQFKAEEMMDVILGRGEHDYGLEGELYYAKTGKDRAEADDVAEGWEHLDHDEPSNVNNAQFLIGRVARFTDLQQKRQEALAQEQPDPLRDQMREMFKV